MTTVVIPEVRSIAAHAAMTTVVILEVRSTRVRDPEQDWQGRPTAASPHARCPFVTDVRSIGGRVSRDGAYEAFAGMIGSIR